MKSKKNIKVQLSMLALLLGMFWGSESFAIGMGFTFGQADEEWEDNNVFSSTNTDFDVSNFGFVLDTSVAKNKLFNYRFSLLTEENESANGAIKYEGFSTTHDFGFSIFRNQHVKLWVGPRLNVAYYDSYSTSSFSGDTDVLGISYGPVFGINIHTPSVVSFSFTTGFLRGGYAGDNTFGFSTTDVDYDVRSTFFTASVIFRINDEF